MHPLGRSLAKKKNKVVEKSDIYFEGYTNLAIIIDVLSLFQSSLIK